jgi:CubicO group peptidase (beta-lactamase class C family)
MGLLRRFAIGLLCGGVLMASPTFGDGPNNEREGKVDQLFAAYDKADAPGCALGVVRNGELIYKRGYGQGSLELGVPLTPQSVFYMGSVSKQFTAASVVLAAEQGYLSLDDDVRKYIPELPSYGKVITLRAMLHHTSGFRDVLALLFLGGRNFEDIHPTAELVDLVSRQKALNYLPGEEFLYSNSNYFMMSVIIHRATGKTLSAFAEENIFKPLGMSHTRFYEDHSVVVPGRVPAYEPGAGGSFRVDWSTNFDKAGDGGLMSSVQDLLQWDQNFYENKLGKGTLLKELQTRGVLNSGKTIEYALGLFLTTYRGLPVVEHSGALFGYRTELLRFPEQRFSVICLCNLSTAHPSRLANQVADIYLEGALKPEATTAGGATTAHIDPKPYVGSYRNAESHSLFEASAEGDDLVLFGQHLKAAGPGRFTFSPGPELEFTPQGKTGMRMTVHSTDAVAENFDRFEAVQPSAAELAQYAGTYRSDELQAKYTFAVKDGKITLAMNWQEPSALAPSVRDEFHGGAAGASYVFRRDAEGKVAGVDVFAGRVRNIAFTRSKD